MNLTENNGKRRIVSFGQEIKKPESDFDCLGNQIRLQKLSISAGMEVNIQSVHESNCNSQ